MEIQQIITIIISAIGVLVPILAYFIAFGRYKEKTDKNDLSLLELKSDLKTLNTNLLENTSKLENIEKNITELKSDMKDLRDEFKADIQDLRVEQKADNQTLRNELKSDIQDLRDELKADNQALREELKSDMKDLRDELKADMKDLRNEIKVDIHALNNDNKTLNTSMQDLSWKIIDSFSTLLGSKEKKAPSYKIRNNTNRKGSNVVAEKAPKQNPSKDKS